MAERLFVIADAFDLAVRGTALVPALEFDGQGWHATLDVELRRPDGVRSLTRARLMVEHFYPGGYKRVVYVDVPKTEVPPGTEVWTTDG